MTARAMQTTNSFFTLRRKMQAISARTAVLPNMLFRTNISRTFTDHRAYLLARNIFGQR